MPLDSCPILSLSEHAHEVGPTSPDTKAVAMLSDIRVLREVMARFKSFSVDAAEFACMKAIVLFKPGKSNAYEIHFSMFSFFSSY